ncbi:hypothetical protein [Streptomyces platensis]|uniref:hypothetical protein n=1 Tax=Streptomyces platensis TaxID=58346 RepID=UPI00368473A1
MLLLVLWSAEAVELAPDVGEEIREVVGVRTAAPDAVCAHDEAHPPAYPDSQAHLNHLYAPAEFAAPEEARGAEGPGAAPGIWPAWPRKRSTSWRDHGAHQAGQPEWVITPVTPHRGHAGGDDAGRTFACRFLPLPLKQPLADDQGTWLGHIDPRWTAVTGDSQ